MEESFQIFISLPTDDVCTLKGLREDTRVYQLKSRVELKTGIPGDVQHLYFMNKELYDNYQLSDVKLKGGCIVRVKLETTWLNLFEACWRGDIYEVFQNGVQFLDKKEFQGYNIPLWNRIVVQRATHALFIASHRGFLGLVIELLNHGAADINGKTRFGRTCLHVAAYQGFVGCVSLLLSEGALCNQIDFNGKTALALASENGHIYCERRLWLYQMSLKALRGLAPKPASPDSSEGRPNLRNCMKSSRLISNKGPTHDTGEKQGFKKLDFHLPRVQTYDVQSSPSYEQSPGESDHGHTSFPFVQIAEKYRREFTSTKNNNSNMIEGKTDQRPRTAPVPSSQTTNSERNGIEDEELMVKGESNREDRGKDDFEGDDDVFTADKDTNGVDGTIPKIQQQAKETSPVTTGLSQKEITSGKEGVKLQKERPKTSHINVKRHLDLSISTSQEKATSDENQRSPSSEQALDELDYAYYRPQKPGQSFDSWLEKKRTQGQLRPMTAHAPEKSRLGKSIDPDVFKNWLNKKRRSHSRSISESSAVSTRKTYISSGMTFEKWLEEKRKLEIKENESNVSSPDTPDAGRRARTFLAGKTYEEWLSEKMRQVQATSKGEEEDKKNGGKSGKTYEMWLLEKQNQKQIEIIHKATEEKEKQRQLEMEQYQKYLNPNYKTFEEWLAIKNHEHFLERERFKATQNEPSSEDKKKDSDLVFGIWLTMKFVKEMKEEEVKYEEMKEKWERKEKQRAAIRRAININRMMKKKQNTENTDENCKLEISWNNTEIS